MVEKYEVYGYVAKPELLKMLSLHLLGTYSQKKETNARRLREHGVIDANNTVVELSDYFQEQVDGGYFSDDYFEFQRLETFAASESEARKRAGGELWIFGPAVEIRPTSACTATT